MSVNHQDQALVLTGLFARRVAKVTRLSERQIENLHPMHFGAPGHFKFLPGARGGMFYTAKGIVGLLEAMRLAGHVAESMQLCEAARQRAGHNKPAHKPSGRQGWAQQWEAQSL